MPLPTDTATVPAGPLRITGAIEVDSFTNVATIGSSFFVPQAGPVFFGVDVAGPLEPFFMTATQATAVLDLFGNVARGVVPGSGGGSVNFLRADGAWVPVVQSFDVLDSGVSVVGAATALNFINATNITAVVTDAGSNQANVTFNVDLSSVTYTASNGVQLVGNDFRLADRAATSVMGHSTTSGGAPVDILFPEQSVVLRRTGSVLGQAFGDDHVLCRTNGGNLTAQTLQTNNYTDSSVTDAKLRDSVSVSIIGRSALSIGAPADIQFANNSVVLRRLSGLEIEGFQDNFVLRRDGSGNLDSGLLVTGNYGDNTVTNAKLSNMAANTIKVNITGGSADPVDHPLATLAGPGLDYAAGVISVDLSSVTYTGSNGVQLVGNDFQNSIDGTTNSHLDNAPQFTIKCRPFASTGDVVDLAMPDQSVFIRQTGNIAGISASDNHVLRRPGAGGLNFGLLQTGNLGDNIVTNTKLANMPATTLKGNPTGGIGAAQDLSFVLDNTIMARTSGAINVLVGTTNGVLRRQGTGVLQFGLINADNIDLSDNYVWTGLSVYNGRLGVTNPSSRTDVGVQVAYTAGGTISTTNHCRWLGASTMTVDTLARADTGQQFTFFNTTTDQDIIFLDSSNASGTTSDRFFFPNGLNYTLGPRRSATFWHDSTSFRWRLKADSNPVAHQLIKISQNLDFSDSGNYTCQLQTRYVVVTIKGGGGGGGGSSAARPGGGGGEGGTVKFFAEVTGGQVIPYVRGTGGSGGVGSGFATTGNNTTFLAFIATGGLFGTSGKSSGASGLAGRGGLPSGAFLDAIEQLRGATGGTAPGTDSTNGFSGHGGGSGGGEGRNQSGLGAGIDGHTLTGGGGSGAWVLAGTSTGGDGGNGYIIVEEYT